MRSFIQEYTYHHDWETVTAAFWVKYPNEFQPHVLRLDTLNRTFNLNDQMFSVKRLISLEYNVPAWVLKLLKSSSRGYGVEDATCSLKKKNLVIKSSNLTLSSFFKVDEFCEYTVHPTNPKWTLYRQEARYSVEGLGFFSATLEKMAVRSAAEKAFDGLKAMQKGISQLEAANWKHAYADAKTKASEFCGKYASIINMQLSSQPRHLVDEFYSALEVLKDSRISLILAYDYVSRNYLNRRNSFAVEQYDLAQHKYKEALKMVEDRLLHIREGAKRLLFNWNATQALSGFINFYGFDPCGTTAKTRLIADSFKCIFSYLVNRAGEDQNMYNLNTVAKRYPEGALSILQWNFYGILRLFSRYYLKFIANEPSHEVFHTSSGKHLSVPLPFFGPLISCIRISGIPFKYYDDLLVPNYLSLRSKACSHVLDLFQPQSIKKPISSTTCCRKELEGKCVLFSTLNS